MFYTLDNLVEYTALMLDIPLDTKRHVVEAHIIMALRELPIQRFLIPGREAHLSEIDGVLSLPPDFFRTGQQHPYLRNLKAGQKQIRVPKGVTDFRLLYEALPTDEDGLPLIPADFDRAVVLYITAEYLMRSGWMTQKVSRSDYERAVMDFHAESAAVRGRINAPSYQEKIRMYQIQHSPLR